VRNVPWSFFHKLFYGYFVAIVWRPDNLTCAHELTSYLVTGWVAHSQYLKNSASGHLPMWVIWKDHEGFIRISCVPEFHFTIIPTCHKIVLFVWIEVDVTNTLTMRVIYTVHLSEKKDLSGYLWPNLRSPPVHFDIPTSQFLHHSCSVL
jgi:hypothetical protein